MTNLYPTGVKGSRDRDLPLSPKLLEALRQYWRWKKPPADPIVSLVRQCLLRADN